MNLIKKFFLLISLLIYYRLKEIQKQLAEECQMNKALQANQTSWQTKYNTLEKKYKDYQEEKTRELIDVKEQLRDIMFYMQAQTKIAESELKDEIAEGSVIVPEATTEATTSNNKQKNRKKKKN